MRPIDADKIIDEIHYKWGVDPAYFWDDKEHGEEAKRDSYIIELIEAQKTLTYAEIIWPEAKVYNMPKIELENKND